MIRPPSRAIHLDTSFLIRCLVQGSPESVKIREWLRQGRRLRVSAYSWGEFLCGPLGEEEQAAARRIACRHIPVGTAEVTEAAGLFNLGGRRRGSFPDCIIAATAILDAAELATSNVKDFERFLDAGLELAE